MSLKTYYTNSTAQQRTHTHIHTYIHTFTLLSHSLSSVNLSVPLSLPLSPSLLKELLFQFSLLLSYTELILSHIFLDSLLLCPLSASIMHWSKASVILLVIPITPCPPPIAQSSKFLHFYSEMWNWQTSVICASKCFWRVWWQLYIISAFCQTFLNNVFVFSLFLVIKWNFFWVDPLLNFIVSFKI